VSQNGILGLGKPWAHVVAPFLDDAIIELQR